VLDAFVPFTAPLEGVARWMYLDVKGLVTTAIGNLIDPLEYATPLPWKRPDGAHASRQEIEDAWHKIKLRCQHMKLRGGLHPSWAEATSIRLTDEGIRQVVANKLLTNDAHLRKRFAEFESWPGDAQLAIHSLAWACGPAFRFPALERALYAQDFATASREVNMDETGNPGLAPRNAANRLLLENAADVVVDGLDRDRVYWPNRPQRPAGEVTVIGGAVLHHDTIDAAVDDARSDEREQE
jgi:GH24 family phage-related lysozyme (muramidase)